jgi:tRNA(Phe) wybutosine-synthesizing methylase Tyw3
MVLHCTQRDVVANAPRRRSVIEFSISATSYRGLNVRGRKAKTERVAFEDVNDNDRGFDERACLLRFAPSIIHVCCRHTKQSSLPFVNLVPIAIATDFDGYLLYFR